MLLLKRSVLYVCSTLKGCYYPSLEFGIKIASSILILDTVSHSYLESEKGEKFLAIPKVELAEVAFNPV